MSKDNGAVTGEVVLVSPTAEMVSESGVPALMSEIRPQWQAKGLIERVHRLLPVDPSSACQRLFNAAVADLRDKVKIAGIDIAKEAAAAYKLPPVNGADDIDNYSTAKIIDLAHRMGLLTRPEWRRMTRVYDIRRDLEHEDVEYEAGVEDCIYVFKTCIEAVLSKDPVNLIKVSEVKQVIEVAGPAVADPDLVQDYEHAPATRQLEIGKFLVSVALDDAQPDLVRQNAYSVLGTLSASTRDAVRVDLARHLQDQLGRAPLTEMHVRVAHVAGVLPYLKKSQRKAFFQAYVQLLKDVGYHWKAWSGHTQLLKALEEYGGLGAVPDEPLTDILKWMALCYVGEPGGYGAGINRRVFYSNTAAPLIEGLLAEHKVVAKPILEALSKDKQVKRALGSSEHVERRYEALLDIVEE